MGSAAKSDIPNGPSLGEEPVDPATTPSLFFGEEEQMLRPVRVTRNAPARATMSTTSSHRFTSIASPQPDVSESHTGETDLPMLVCIYPEIKVSMDCTVVRQN
jgi:hypothetical protein